MNDINEKYAEEIKKARERILSQHKVPPQEFGEPSPEFLEYIERVKADPSIELNMEQRFAQIRSKLDRMSHHEEFKPSSKQATLMNMLWQYFHHQGSLDSRKGILLIGGMGCGKSTIMKAFCTTHFTKFIPGQDPHPVQITSAIAMIDYYNDQGNFEQFLSRDLYIDDFGSEQRAKYMSKDDDPILSKFLERFYSTGNRVFATTNLNKEELLDKYGRRVYSRLHELCNIIEMQDKDFRM